MVYRKVIMSLYFLSRGNNIFSTRLESRTWLVGVVRKRQARFLAKQIKNNDGKSVTISNIDYKNGELAKSLILNGLGLVVADDFAIIEDEIVWSGNTVDYQDYEYINISDAQKKHLDDLYDFYTQL